MGQQCFSHIPSSPCADSCAVHASSTRATRILLSFNLATGSLIRVSLVLLIVLLLVHGRVAFAACVAELLVPGSAAHLKPRTVHEARQRFALPPTLWSRVHDHHHHLSFIVLLYVITCTSMLWYSLHPSSFAYPSDVQRCRRCHVTRYERSNRSWSLAERREVAQHLFLSHHFLHPLVSAAQLVVSFAPARLSQVDLSLPRSPSPRSLIGFHENPGRSCEACSHPPSQLI